MGIDISTRRYEFDWLRIFAILIVFVYHSTRFFNLGDWHVKNVDTYVWVEMWNAFSTRWMMPLFFVISGASLFYAIGKTGGWSRFYVDKFLRLMIPVLLASVTHSAIQVYFERLTHSQFSGSFFSFLPEYFNGVYMGFGMPGNFAWHGMHLWYLFFLFLYGLICYRLFVWLKGSGKEVLNRITTLVAMPGLIYIWFSIPLAILKLLIPDTVLNVGSGGWGFLYYFWFLIAGFIIVSNDRLQQLIKNQCWISLMLGMMLSAVHLFQLFGHSHLSFTPVIGNWIYAVLSYLIAWSWIFAFLGFGIRFFTVDRPILKYANEGVLPFYILHQTVLLIVGYFIVSWKLHDVFKWVIIFASSFFIIMFLYLYLIRNTELLRFLFGMKTSSLFYKVFRKKRVLVPLHMVYLGLIVMAVILHITIVAQNRSPIPLTYDSEQDIILNAESITDQSSSGIRVVNDNAVSMGRAIEFYAGAVQKAESQPKVYFEMSFSAPAGRYFIWIRGKTDLNNGYTDSVWAQVDDQIGTRNRSVRLGNWFDVLPVGVYGWAGDTDDPVTIVLKSSGDHKIRLQPRQIPHRIDQIWLSRTQHRIPNTKEFIKSSTQ